MATKTAIVSGPIDCACVIHGTAYDWIYVERLYNMLSRHITPGIRLHVYTEAERPVPEPMIKHTLIDWGITGPKRSWWYKIQLFNTEHHVGPLLYFDLDVVITQNIDWIWQLPLQHFWAVRDFPYLWRPTTYNINSSIMWWDTTNFSHIYQEFVTRQITTIIGRYRGDQNYINERISPAERRFLDPQKIKSWRWQANDGGYDFATKLYRAPGTGTSIANPVSVLVFHGKPKPDTVSDPVIIQHWQ